MNENVEEEGKDIPEGGGGNYEEMRIGEKW